MARVEQDAYEAGFADGARYVADGCEAPHGEEADRIGAMLRELSRSRFRMENHLGELELLDTDYNAADAVLEDLHRSLRREEHRRPDDKHGDQLRLFE